VKNPLFDSLFLVNIVFSRGISVCFFKGTMYGYLYCENGGLEQLPDDVGFVLNLSINVEILLFLCF